MSQGNGYAAESAQQPKMDVPGGEQRLQGESRSVRSKDQEAVTSKGVGSQRHENKQSLDYAMRTGLAGGLAGCAVSKDRK